MYIVAPGNSFITARGNIGPGREIRKEDFAAEDSFLRLVSQKRIVAGKSNEVLEKEAREKEAANAKMAKEKADKKKQDAKTKTANQLAVAETALKNAREAYDTALKTADKTHAELFENHKARLDELAKKVEDHEKAVKDAEAALEKPKPEQKEDAEKNVLAATESLESAKKELSELQADTTLESPEHSAATATLEKANDAVIEAEANLAEAKQAVAKAE